MRQNARNKLRQESNFSKELGRKIQPFNFHDLLNRLFISKETEFLAE